MDKVIPKLPMRDKVKTMAYYKALGFTCTGDYDNYLIMDNHGIELHFFLFEALNPNDNYGQIYFRSNDIDGLYQNLIDLEIEIHPNGKLETKPWGQKEFSLLDPDKNLITFGESI